MNYVIDASVFVAAARTAETHYAVSVEFLRQAQEQNTVIVCPTLILAECSAAIARPTGNPALAEALVALIENFHGLNLATLTTPLARQAATIAATHLLRGADSVYVAVAQEFEATLITWDDEMLNRGASVVSTMTPSMWLDTYKAKAS